PKPGAAAANGADRDRRPGPVQAGPRAAPGERVEIRPGWRRREHRRLAGGRDDLRLRHRRRPGRPGGGLGERFRAVRPDRGPGAVARLRDRAVCGAAADGCDGRPRLARAERLWREPVRRGAAGGALAPTFGLTRNDAAGCDASPGNIARGAGSIHTLRYYRDAHQAPRRDIVVKRDAGSTYTAGYSRDAHQEPRRDIVVKRDAGSTYTAGYSRDTHQEPRRDIVVKRDAG